jgi:hypothetical protein
MTVPGNIHLVDQYGIRANNVHSGVDERADTRPALARRAWYGPYGTITDYPDSISVA